MSHERAIKRTKEGVVEEPVPKSDKGLGSKRKREKVEIQISIEARTEVLKTQKVLCGRVYDPNVMPKPGMRDLPDAVELQLWTHLFVSNVQILHEQQIKQFYNQLVKLMVV